METSNYRHPLQPHVMTPAVAWRHFFCFLCALPLFSGCQAWHLPGFKARAVN
jgi:hypothetical protein